MGRSVVVYELRRARNPFENARNMFTTPLRALCMLEHSRRFWNPPKAFTTFSLTDRARVLCFIGELHELVSRWGLKCEPEALDLMQKMVSSDVLPIYPSCGPRTCPTYISVKHTLTAGLCVSP